jgi:integrase/recombinase XerD
LRAFQVHLTETGVRPPTINAAVAALRFFKVMLDQPETSGISRSSTKPRKLPRVLSPEEVLGLRRLADLLCCSSRQTRPSSHHSPAPLTRSYAAV